MPIPDKAGAWGIPKSFILGASGIPIPGRIGAEGTTPNPGKEGADGISIPLRLGAYGISRIGAAGIPELIEAFDIPGRIGAAGIPEMNGA